MTEIIIGCIIWTALSIGTIAGAIIEDEQELFGVGVAFLILTIIFGWGMMASIIPVSSKESIVIPSEIAITKYTVFVKIDGKDITSTDARFVNAPQDSIAVKKTIGKNSYGIELTPYYELMIKD
jgi:hypothetical protein